MDLYSIQAEIFMKILKEHVSKFPADNAARQLLSWDLRYDTKSVGAPIFESVYNQLFQQCKAQRTKPPEIRSNSNVPPFPAN